MESERLALKLSASSANSVTAGMATVVSSSPWASRRDAATRLRSGTDSQRAMR